MRLIVYTHHTLEFLVTLSDFLSHKALKVVNVAPGISVAPSGVASSLPERPFLWLTIALPIRSV
jgi:hypothetical protein